MIGYLAMGFVLFIIGLPLLFALSALGCWVYYSIKNPNQFDFSDCPKEQLGYKCHHRDGECE